MDISERMKLSKEEQRAIIVREAQHIDEMLKSKGWEILNEQYIQKGLSRNRFLGARAGKLLWVQGFQAALDGLENYITSKIAAGEKIVQEEEIT